MGLKATLIAFSAASSTQGFRQTPTYRSNNCDDGRAAYSTRSSNARTSAILAKEKLFCTTYCSERRVFADNGAHGGSRGSNNHRRSSYFFLQMTADTDETTSSTTPDVPTPSPKAGENVMVDRGRKGVSRALNRALGRILSTGDMFGGVGEKGVSDGEKKCGVISLQVELPVLWNIRAPLTLLCSARKIGQGAEGDLFDDRLRLEWHLCFYCTNTLS